MSQRLGMFVILTRVQYCTAAVRSAIARLFLFRVHGVLAKTLAVFAEFQLLAAGFTAERVVVIARLIAYQKDGSCFLFALTHEFLLTPIC